MHHFLNKPLKNYLLKLKIENERFELQVPLECNIIYVQ